MTQVLPAGLRELVPDSLWHAQQPLRFGPIELATRMTIVRLQDGGLWVHSPIQPTPALLASVSRLGTVRHVVAPNRSHHLFFLPFITAFPGAEGWIAPGLADKRPDLRAYPELSGNEPWAGELRPFFIHGLPQLNETVWFHAETGTLVLTDLLFRVGQSTSMRVRLAARALGIYERLGMSRTMKLLVKDRARFAASVAPLLELPVQRIVLAHDSVVEVDARSQLRAAFGWLGTARD